MIDWIKFSERHPEKEGTYLCFDGDMLYLLHWSIYSSNYGFFPDSAYDDNYSYPNKPDYWAEINLPMEAKGNESNPA